jgi:methyl-accepting chemotaxis protein
VREHADIFALAGGLGVCAAACALTGGLGPLVGGMALALAPNFYSDLFSRLADRYRAVPHDPSQSAKNHDLRELVVVSIQNVIDEFVKDRRPKGTLAAQIKTLRRLVKERLIQVASDDRFADIWEQNIVGSYFHQQVEEFQHVVSLTPGVWQWFVGMNETDADAARKDGLEALADKLHRDLPRHLVGVYRDSFKQNPHILIAVQTAILNGIWETAKRTEANTEELKSKLDALIRGTLTVYPHAVDEETRVYLQTVEWIARETRELVEKLVQGVERLQATVGDVRDMNTHIVVTTDETRVVVAETASEVREARPKIDELVKQSRESAGKLDDLAKTAEEKCKGDAESKAKIDEVAKTTEELKKSAQQIQSGIDEIKARPAPAAGYYLPRTRNQTFVGRAQDLDDLGRKISEAKGAVVLGFSGEGGIGKSQLVQRYFEESAERWDGRWWLDCSRSGHRGELVNLAAALGVKLDAEQSGVGEGDGLESIRAWHHAARQKIAQKLCAGGRHLLVLDNVERAGVDQGGGPDPRSPHNEPWQVIEDFALPQGCAVVLTTRDQQIPQSLARVQRLGVLSREDSRALLLQRFVQQQEAHAGKPPVPKWKDQECDALAEHLDHHALAIDLVAAHLFLEEGAVSPAKLLKRLSTDEAILALFEDEELSAQAHKYLVSVGTTLALHMDAPGLKEALPLVHAAAFCAPGNIPVWLLAFMANTGEETARKLIRKLEGRSILSYAASSSGQAVEIHRLTQIVVRARLRRDKEYEGCLLKVLRSFFHLYRWPDSTADEVDDHQGRWERVAGLAHAQAALRQADGANLDSPALQASRLRREFTHRLAEIGQISWARQEIEAAIAWEEKQSPPDVRRLSIYRSTRASILQAQGDLPGALEDISYAIEWRQKMPPVDERSVVI